MENNIITTNLQKLENHILSNMTALKNNTYNICVNLAQIKKCLVDTTSNISEYSEKRFGFKKSQTYAFLGIADKLDVKINNQGLPYATNSIFGTADEDFSPTVLGIIAKIDNNTITRALEDGEITLSSKVDEIKEWKKSLLAIETKTEDTETEDTETETEDTENETEDTENETEDTETSGNLETTFLHEYGRLDIKLFKSFNDLSDNERYQMYIDFKVFIKTILNIQ